MGFLKVEASIFFSLYLTKSFCESIKYFDNKIIRQSLPKNILVAFGRSEAFFTP